MSCCKKQNQVNTTIQHEYKNDLINLKDNNQTENKIITT